MKNQTHLTTDELVEALYQEASPAHLASCPGCGERLASMRAQLAALPAPAVRAEQLARQRSAIYARLDAGSGFNRKWLWAAVPVGAAALLLSVDLPGDLRGRQRVQVAEEQAVTAQVAVAQPGDTLYSDIYESLSTQTPAGVDAVSGMFEVASSGAGEAKAGVTKN